MGPPESPRGVVSLGPGSRPLDVAWLLARASDVPAGDEWLGREELVLLAGRRSAARRETFRLGRWSCKGLLAPMLDGASAAIEILTAPDGSPVPFLAGVRVRREDDDGPVALALSLSHRGGTGLAAATWAARAVGCDLELVEARSAAFVRDYLRPREQALVVSAAAWGGAPLVANLCWSAKESALKALRVGLARDPRELEVELDAPLAPTASSTTAVPWSRLSVLDHAHAARFDGAFAVVDGFVLTLVVR